MELYIIPIALFVVVFLLSELLKKDPLLKYQKISFLLNHSELTFYKYLQLNIPTYISIMAKVRLADIVKPILRGKSYIVAKNRIISKHIDFVLIDNNTSEIKALIELNGKSHQRLDRITRDTFIQELTQSINLNFFTIKVKSQYNLDDIGEILKAIKK